MAIKTVPPAISAHFPMRRPTLWPILIPHIGRNQRRTSYNDRGPPDRDPSQPKSHPDCQCVHAGGNRQGHEPPTSHGIKLLGILAGVAGLVYHMRAYCRQKSARDPVAEASGEAGKALASEPPRDGHERLAESEVPNQPEGLPAGAHNFARILPRQPQTYPLPIRMQSLLV